MKIIHFINLQSLSACLLVLFFAALIFLCCVWAFSSCGEQGQLASCGAWTSHCGRASVASVVGVLGGFSSGAWWASIFNSWAHGASVVVVQGLRCPAATKVLWDLSRPGMEPVSPTLAGRFLTIGPLGMPLAMFFFFIFLLKDNCFIEFCCFLSNLNMNQP